MNLQELNYLAEDPASVSWPVKLLALMILLGFILFFGYRLLVVDSLDALSAVKSKEAELKSTLEIRQRRASQLDAYEMQLAEMQRSFGTLIQQLPSSTEIPSLVLDISEKGVVNGLEIELFEPTKEREMEFYAEKPIRLQALGTYRQLASFVSDISGLPRIVTIHDIKLTPLEDSSNSAKRKVAFSDKSQAKRRLRMEAVIKTYRYLEENKDESSKRK